MRVKVYYNLHKKLFSVVALEGEHKGKVVQHSRSVTLTSASFKVSEAGRQRVLRTGHKNVHAYVMGTRAYDIPLGERAVAVSYNPRKAGHFYQRGTDLPLYSANKVHMSAPAGAPPSVIASI